MSPRIPIRLLAAQSDQRLLALVRDGHERAFEALVQRYRRPLLRYCKRSMRLSEERSEDVLQHALLQAWLALAGGTQVQDLKPWLYRIVHNAAVNVMRSSSEGVTELTDAMHARVTGTSESDLDRTMAVREALTGVAALPQMQRQAVFLTAVDGQTHDEVAKALGITHGAVRGLLYRARATLRSAAAAITPQSLIQWASGGAGSAPSTERVAELSAGGGAIGMTAVLAKGAVIAVTAGALVTGAAVVHGPGHAADRARGQTTASPRSAGSAGAADVQAVSAGGASAGVPAAWKAGGASTRETAAAGARAKVRRAHRVLAVLPVKPGTAGDSKPAVGAPTGRHGDGQGGGAQGGRGPGGGADSISTDLADAAGPSGSLTHGGQDSRGESNHGSDSSGKGLAGERPAGTTGDGGGGSEGSGRHEVEPSPAAGQGQGGEPVGEGAKSGGDHAAAVAEPTGKTDG
jgi:RNA polymerase sigma factor (sigma-70 family)